MPENVRNSSFADIVINGPVETFKYRDILKLQRFIICFVLATETTVLLLIINKAGTSKVGAILEAQKTQNF